MDATRNDDSFFMLQELTQIKARAYDKLYPQFKSFDLIPVSMETDPGAQAVVYEQYDRNGMAKIISSYANDLPRADVAGKQISSMIRTVGTSYVYTQEDILAARMANKPLQQRKANAAKMANDQEIDNLAWFGSSEHNMVGFLNQPNVPVVTVAADGVGASTKFKDKTADQILRDLNLVVNSIISRTKGVESPDTLLLPPDQYTMLATMPRSTVSDTTILDFFIKNSPYITNVEMVNQLVGAGTGGVDMMVAYRKDIDKVWMELPLAFMQMDVQPDNLNYKVPCMSRFGGVITPYPLSMVYGEGI